MLRPSFSLGGPVRRRCGWPGRQRKTRTLLAFACVDLALSLSAAGFIQGAVKPTAIPLWSLEEAEGCGAPWTSGAVLGVSSRIARATVQILGPRAPSRPPQPTRSAPQPPLWGCGALRDLTVGRLFVSPVLALSLRLGFFEISFQVFHFSRGTCPRI